MLNRQKGVSHWRQRVCDIPRLLIPTSSEILRFLQELSSVSRWYTDDLDIRQSLVPRLVKFDPSEMIFQNFNSNSLAPVRSQHPKADDTTTTQSSSLLKSIPISRQHLTSPTPTPTPKIPSTANTTKYTAPPVSTMSTNFPPKPLSLSPRSRQYYTYSMIRNM